MRNEPPWFEHGKEFSEVFETRSGWIIVSSEVAVMDRELHLLNFDYRPLEVNGVSVGVPAALAILRTIRSRAAEGYTSLVIDGVDIGTQS